MMTRVRESDSMKRASKRSRTTNASHTCSVTPNEPASAMLGKRGMIHREEYIRLLEQSLAELGFNDCASQLAASSGIPLESKEAEELRLSILKGDWQTAVSAISQIYTDGTCIEALEAQFYILEQKFLEQVILENPMGAVSTLRTELAPLGVLRPRLHSLPSLLISPDMSFSFVSTRGRLLEKLQRLLPAGVLLSPCRLEVLVEEALTAQFEKCPFLNDPDVHASLLKDYTCTTKEQLPSKTTQILRQGDNSDEIWHVAFSPSGTALAAASRDGSVAVWNIPPKNAVGVKRKITLRFVSKQHTAPVAFLAWSPEGNRLASCGQDARVCIWDTQIPQEGRLVSELLHHTEPVTCCAWIPSRSYSTNWCSTQLVTGSQDRKIALVNIYGEVSKVFETQKVQELAVARQGRYILAATSERRVHIIDLHSGTETSLEEPDILVSMSLSPSERYLLTNISSLGHSIWDLGTDPSTLKIPLAPCGRYTAPPSEQRQRSMFVVRSCVGGLGERFIASGSEHGVARIWHRESGELLLTLEGHQGTVNGVAWNPSRYQLQMVASCGDDGSIRIWEPEGVESREQSEEERKESRDEEGVDIVMTE